VSLGQAVVFAPSFFTLGIVLKLFRQTTQPATIVTFFQKLRSRTASGLTGLRFYDIALESRTTAIQIHNSIPQPSLQDARNMARKTDDLLADLDQLGLDEQPQQQQQQQQQQQHSAVIDPPTAPPPAPSATEDDEDPLAGLQAQLAVRPPQQQQGTSRPGTPRNAGTNVRKQEFTPASSGPSSARNSEDRGRGTAATAAARTSAETGRTYHLGVTPQVGEEGDPRVKKTEDGGNRGGEGGGGGGGWWGSMFSAASAAVKQAESLAKEIRGNEEALRWAEQVRGNISHLQHFGMFRYTGWVDSGWI